MLRKAARPRMNRMVVATTVMMTLLAGDHVDGVDADGGVDDDADVDDDEDAEYEQKLRDSAARLQRDEDVDACGGSVDDDEVLWRCDIGGVFNVTHERRSQML